MSDAEATWVNDGIASRRQSAASPPDTTAEQRVQISKERAEALRKKVQSVARLMRVFKTLRQQNELIVQLKGVTPGHRIPPGALMQGKEGLKNELDKFRDAKKKASRTMARRRMTHDDPTFVIDDM
eukprot:CAMPEP_0113849824 /NCGR_PEP_ID=MMETSP0372-20130328/3410_1 /TAXON_ID=340204 /ORGANISM="Lankesteria abbotti" /LENGTH=125 /DNA_ID=CAMNT_0000819787 /DNA_START=1 /DNA_END=378 /DNA_ORIENTATION=+ /assembly_acc=CAM_ASM_000359